MQHQNLSHYHQISQERVQLSKMLFFSSVFKKIMSNVKLLKKTWLRFELLNEVLIGGYAPLHCHRTLLLNFIEGKIHSRVKPVFNQG